MDFEEKRRVRRAFSQAASSYRRGSVVQAEVEARLLDRLELIKLDGEQVRNIVDLGAGIGTASTALHQRFPGARLVAIDAAWPMLDAHREQRSRANCVQAYAEAIPLADNSIDLVFSSAMLQWCTEPDRVFAEVRRVLAPGGLFLFSTFGPDTLMELRHAWECVEPGGHPRVNSFVDMHHLGDGMLKAGFSDPVMDIERLTVEHSSVRSALADLKKTGANQVLDRRRARGMGSARKLDAMMTTYEQKFGRDGVIPMTWEVVYGHGIEPQPGQPRRVDGGGEEVSFSIDHLRGSRR